MMRSFKSPPTLALCAVLTVTLALLTGATAHTPATRSPAVAAVVLPSPEQTHTARLGSGDNLALRDIRLRKLHLVRPDLIPYPIAYEVIC